MEKIEISIGVCAYNEQKNIQFLLESILKQRLDNFAIREIIVVSDGSTDRTDEIVNSFAQDGRIRMIKLTSRCGKYAAVNSFLESATASILVLSSADIILAEDAIERLCFPFINNDKLGITGAHPSPVDLNNSFLGYVVNLQWYLHHKLSLLAPKFGELVAFRNNLITELPPTLVDEELVAYLVKNKGYQLQYVPEAIIYNKGPDSVEDFYVQRKRIYIGHLILKKEYNYSVATLGSIRILKCLFKNFPSGIKKNWYRLLGAILLEGMVRIVGRFEFYIKKGRFDYKWKIAGSTKDPAIQLKQ